MRTLFFVAALAALFGAYWTFGASQVESRAQTVLAELEARGWTVKHGGLDVTGFPSRFDATVTDLRLTSPDRAWAWAASVFQVHALSYRPNRIVATWPPEQSLTVAGQRIEIASQGLEASATVGLSPDLPLDVATLEGRLSTVSSGAGWGLALDRLLATVRRAGTASYDLVLEAEGLHLAKVSADLGQLRLDAQITLDAPLDRRLQGAPRLIALALREARLAQGKVALTASGDLAPDAQGFLAGTVLVTAENWRGLLDLLDAAGILVYDQAPFLQGALEQLAQGSDRIELPLTFRDGQVEALGLVLLPAPQVL